MLLCVSLNPAIDRRLRLDAFQRGCVNRASQASPAPGGKAAHVAMVLRTLGADPLWLGFAGGATGSALLDGLRHIPLRVHAVPTAGSTRMNLEIIEDDGTVSEILEPGPCIAAAELRRFQDAFEAILRESRTPASVILSGSLPLSVPRDYYATLTALAHRYGSRVFIDTSGEPLRLALEAGPEFVKPNQAEAEWLSGKAVQGPSSAAGVLKEILRMGAREGSVSLGANGLLWGSNKGDTLFLAQVPQQQARFSVGCGDSTLAGFAFAAEHGLKPVDALRLAAACGVANCMADGPGRARATDVDRLKDAIRIEVLH
jgi:1-phosphofructokinase family hexose kinase